MHYIVTLYTFLVQNLDSYHKTEVNYYSSFRCITMSAAVKIHNYALPVTNILLSSDGIKYCKTSHSVHHSSNIDPQQLFNVWNANQPLNKSSLMHTLNTIIVLLT